MTDADSPGAAGSPEAGSAAPGSAAAGSTALADVVAVVDRLRRNCPWDAEQTHRSLARYLLEETHEALESIDTGDSAHLLEELGDVLFQVFFHARIAAEGEPDGSSFDIDDVARGLGDKLIARHPHVFAPDTPAGSARTATQVRQRWEELKAEEKARASVLDGIPATLPALAMADKLAGRAERVGVDAAAVAAEHGGVGGQLLRLVLQARASGLDPEQELRDATRALRAAIVAAESAN